MQFTGPNEALERAVKADDADAVHQALASGADVNARGKHDVTPLLYAVGIGSKNAASALIEKGANPNLKDAEGDCSVTLAVQAYARDPQLLQMVLDAGGDPNAKRPNGNPVMTRFINDHNLDAITYMHSKGADLNIDISEQPMVVNPAITGDWDVVLHLLKLGASIDTPKARDGLVFFAKSPELTPTDSPLYPARVEVYEYLKSKGLEIAPPMPPDGRIPAPAIRDRDRDTPK